MYLYLLMAAVVLFGIWFTSPLERFSSTNMSLSNKPLWKVIGKVTVVSALFLAVLAVTSSYAARYSKSGLTAYHQGRYAAAEADLRRAENFDPHDLSAHYYRGMCLLHDGEKSDALTEFRHVYSSCKGTRYQSDTTRQLVQETQAQIEQLTGEPP